MTQKNTQKSSIFKSMLSLITYKEKKKVKEFYIPEVGETEEVLKEREGKQTDDSTRNKSGNTNKNSKESSKPKDVSEYNKARNHQKVQADDKSIPYDIESNIDFIKRKFNAPANKDIIIRELTVGGKYRAFIAYIDGMVDRITVNNFIMNPLLREDKKYNDDDSCQLDYILNNVLETHQARKVNKPEEIIYGILLGDTGLYVDGCDYYIFNETKGYDKRGVEQPQIEGVVRGSQEAFNETLRTNITLIRKTIKNSRLTTEFLTVGERNNNLCAIMYIDGLINPAIVKEVKRRINGVKTDLISSTVTLEHFIEDHQMGIIPTVLATERPDRAASHIVEGKVAILSDGAPFALVVPVTLNSLIHSPEDSSFRWQFGALLRLVRLFAIFVATMLPGLYVALTNFHREMIPTELLIAIAKARENVPFPTIVEVLLMEISFELIREAGIRIPGIIGNTIGIIGALILGQAAVQASLVSPVIIIVIAITGLGNFAIPDFSLAFSARLLRLVFIMGAALLGFYGISLVLVSSIILLVNLKSFGVPFFSILGPKTRRSYDMFIRWPIWLGEFRPDNVNPLDVRRQPEISRQWKEENPETGYDKEDGDE